MNKVILIGNLAADPEIRYTNDEPPLCIANYRLAVKRIYKRSGEPEVDYFTCVAFGKNAEFVANYLIKGRRIGVEGRLQKRSYTNKDGITVFVTEIIVENQDIAENKNQTNTDDPRSGFMPLPKNMQEELPFK